MKVLQILNSNCPNIVSIVGNNDKFWSKVESRYLQRLAFLQTSIQEKNYLSIRKTLIDNIILFKSERNKLSAFLHDIDFKVKTIYDNFSSNKTKVDKLRPILKQIILTDFKESKSYDRIAEIYAIHYLISRKKIKIIELEYKLTNRKNIDCLVQNVENGEYILLDFVSINSSKVETPEKFGRWLADKIVLKYTQKTCNLVKLDYPFRVFPILWLEDKILKDNFDLLVDSETNLNTEFYILRGIENITDNKYHYIFGSIDELKYWG